MIFGATSRSPLPVVHESRVDRNGAARKAQRERSEGGACAGAVIADEGGARKRSVGALVQYSTGTQGYFSSTQGVSTAPASATLPTPPAASVPPPLRHTRKKAWRGAARCTLTYTTCDDHAPTQSVRRTTRHEKHTTYRMQHSALVHATSHCDVIVY